MAAGLADHVWELASSRFKGCHNCGAKAMNLGEIVAGNTIGPGGSTSVGGQIAPMLQVVCGSCAYVHLFAAVPMGLP